MIINDLLWWLIYCLIAARPTTWVCVKSSYKSNGSSNEIDISKYEVILPDNGFFVGIELIGPVDADGHLIKEIKGAERIDIRGEIKKTSNGYQTMIKINEDRWIDMADYIKGLVPKERFVNVSFGLDILN